MSLKPRSTFPGCGIVALVGIAQLDQNLERRPLDRCDLAKADKIIGKLQASRDGTGCRQAWEWGGTPVGEGWLPSAGGLTGEGSGPQPGPLV